MECKRKCGGEHSGGEQVEETILISSCLIGGVPERLKRPLSMVKQVTERTCDTKNKVLGRYRNIKVEGIIGKIEHIPRSALQWMGQF